MRNILFIISLFVIFSCEKENTVSVIKKKDASQVDNVTTFSLFDANGEVDNPKKLSWIRLPDAPVKRVGGFTFIIDNVLYIGGGQTYNADFSISEFSDLKAFNFKTGIWKSLAPFPGGNLNGPISFSLGNKGYVGLGYNSSRGSIADFWEYDVLSNTWKKIESFPGEPRNLATVFTINEKAYVGAGNERGFINHKDFYCFSPSTGRWSQISDFGGEALYGASAFTINNKAYVVGGVTGLDTRIKECWEYDSGFDKWERKKDFPGEPLLEAIAFSIKNKGYCGLGNISNNEVSSDFYQYNPVKNCWKKDASFPDATRFVASYTGTSKYGVLSGGYKGATAYNDLWVFVPHNE